MLDANDNNDDIVVNDNAKDDKPTELWMTITTNMMTIGRNEIVNLMIIKIAKTIPMMMMSMMTMTMMIMRSLMMMTMTMMMMMMMMMTIGRGQHRAQIRVVWS